MCPSDDEVELVVKHGTSSPRFSLSTSLTNGHHGRNVVGTFAEALACHYLGAEPYTGPSIPTPFGELNPDLFLRDSTTFIEVKAAQMGKYFHIDEDQLKAYAWAAAQASTPIARPRILYACFGYRLKQPLKKYTSVGDLLRVLVHSVECGTILDLSLIQHLATRYGTTKRYETSRSAVLGAWEPLHRITPNRLLPFSNSPKEALSSLELAGRWTTRKYDTGNGGSRKQIPFPTLTVVGPLKPFPLASAWRPLSYRRFRGPFPGRAEPLIPQVEEPNYGYLAGEGLW